MWQSGLYVRNVRNTFFTCCCEFFDKVSPTVRAGTIERDGESHLSLILSGGHVHRITQNDLHLYCRRPNNNHIL